MTKTKKILLSAIITGIITILALTTALAIISPLKNVGEKINGEAICNLSNYSTYRDFEGDYSKFSTFVIASDNDAKVMTEFALYSLENPDKFLYKKVILNSDVDTLYFPGFNGTLDGQGHTIKRLYQYKMRFKENGGIVHTLGSGAVIKNIKVTNVEANLPGVFDGGDAFIDYKAGGIAYINNGTIDSCIIETVKVESTRSKGDAYFATLAVVNNGVVANNIIQGSYRVNSTLDAYSFIIDGNPARNCIFLSTPIVDDKSTFHTQTGSNENYSSYLDAHTAWKNGGYDECSNIPGTIEDYPNYPWFQYGNGSGVTFKRNVNGTLVDAINYLRLRAFMTFTTYTITAGEGGNVKNTLTDSVGKSAILCVPSEFEGISYTSSDGVGYASPTNYKATSDGDAIFTVETVADEYYIFDGWNDTTATFKRNKTIIQFVGVTVGETTISGSGEIVVDYLDGEPLGDPNYDKTNHTLTYTYSVDGTPTTFVYNFADENAWTVDVTNGSAYSWDATGSAKLTITPTFKLKEYGSVWQ